MGWIVLGIALIAVVLLLRAGRKRNWSGASTKYGVISRDDGVNYGNIQVQSQQPGPGSGGGGGGSFG